MSTILSIAFHEFGHAIAAARSLCLAFSFLFFSVRCVACFLCAQWYSEHLYYVLFCLLMNNFPAMFWHILFYMCNSEGVEIEYVAIFVAVLFPGAFVALNYDLLQNRPLFSMLRIYCAGIWHNVVVSHAIVHWLFPNILVKHLFWLSLFIFIIHCHLLWMYVVLHAKLYRTCNNGGNKQEISI
jgi:hypothetical protein